ncbi:MAG: HAMP domain-containing histidine kinase [Clostridia bacterium]|nr:HAMP domain-containing histidine kinase [Clostridia bacterium]
MSKSITQRWLLKYLSVTIVFLLLVIFCGSFAVRSYFYENVKNNVSKVSDDVVHTFYNANGDVKETSDTAVKAYFENFSEKENMTLSVLSEKGDVVRSSSGTYSETQITADFEQALNADDKQSTWIGDLGSGDKILSHTVVVRDGNGKFVTAFRLVKSLADTDNKMLLVIMILIASVMIILASVVIPGLMFIATIVKPVRELSATSRRIAQGDFETRVDKMYDDEIGELADSINHMSEEIKASDRMKNDFISSVSHELRTPLTAIKGWAETMSIGEPDPATMGKGLSVIINETERLTGMVEELLDFSRIQNGRMVMVMDKIDMLAELDEAVYMLRERAASEKKHFVYDEPEHLSPVLGDKNRLRQVFINIIDNALKYTPEGGVIGIQVTEENDTINVVISDTGCGIAEKDLPRIKDKFYKANQTVRGSGIGLAVADEIVTLHKGKLEIQSTEDVGTTVTISIPVLDSDDEEILKS